MAGIEKYNLKNYSLTEIIGLAERLGKKAFTGRQLYKWIFRHGLDNFEEMTDLSKEFRTKLDEQCRIGKLNLVEEAAAADDAAKSLWQTHDELFIESVVIPDADRLTLCISSQVGCPLGCSFCATGKLGFKRNLSSGEIYDQYLLTKLGLSNNARITNIVFMGMGEPLLNYANVLKACAILTDQLGAGLSAKKITISTVGLVESIYRLADDSPKLNLAISLHSAIEEKRIELIPIAKKYPLQDLKEAAIYYAEKADDRITFEYLLIKGINDSLGDAKALADYVRGIPCKINLIVFNPVAGLPFERPEPNAVETFQEYLLPRTPAVTIRKSKGDNIAAACGQLAGIRIKS